VEWNVVESRQFLQIKSNIYLLKSKTQTKKTQELNYVLNHETKEGRSIQSRWHALFHPDHARRLVDTQVNCRWRTFPVVASTTLNRLPALVRAAYRRNLRWSTGTPTFWTEGYSTPHFSGQKVKNLLSPAVKRGDLRRLNYNKIIFGRSSAPDPTERAHDAPPGPRVGWGGDISSPFSSFCIGT